MSLVNDKITIASFKRNLKKRLLTKRNIIINVKSEVLSKRFDEITNLFNGKALAINKDEQGVIQKGLINVKGDFIVEIKESEF